MDQPPDRAATDSASSKSLKDFATFKSVFATLNQGFAADVQTDQLAARAIRRLEVDVEQMRQDGRLEAHETFIPVRTIDANIKQKMPQKMQYLKSANRLAVFEPEVSFPGEQQPDTARLDSEFWRVLTYPGWEIPYIRVTDGAELSGYDWLKVLYTPTPTRPGSVSIEHVGRANLLFDVSVTNIQDSKLIAERVPTTLVSLTRLAKEFKFKMADVLQLREKIALFNTNQTLSSGTGETYDQSVCIYRIFFKEGGVVFTTWYAIDIDHYLTDPVEFYNGVDEQVEIPLPPGMSLEPQVETTWRPVSETDYPYNLVVRNITEDARITESVGAVTSDYPNQEAASSIFTSIVNQAVLSARTMWSPAGDSFDKTGAPKQLALKFENGQIWDREMKAFNAPPPDSMLPKVLDSLQQLNAVQNNSIAWAVQNRQDSRKTATEVTAASQTQSQVNSSETFMLSIALRPVFMNAWRIVQSQALQGLIIFCPLNPQQNDITLISGKYTIKAAGDTDFVEKQMTVANMQQDWPIVQNTPAAIPFMEDYFRLRYPNRARVYIAALQQGDAQNDAINQQRKALLQQAVTDENGMLTPEFQPYAEKVQALIADAPGDTPTPAPAQQTQ